MWLVDPWFADSRELVKVRRIEFHRRLHGTAAPAIESLEEATVAEAPSDDTIASESLDAWAEPPPRRFHC
jgi:hypothetical protein